MAPSAIVRALSMASAMDAAMASCRHAHLPWFRAEMPNDFNNLTGGAPHI
jgi:hypothetical protein